MARGQHLSPYQKGVVKRYYEHKDTLATQKLGEIVSELYLCTDPKKADRLWQRVHKALVNTGTNAAFTDKLMKDRDIERLAAYLAKLF